MTEFQLNKKYCRLIPAPSLPKNFEEYFQLLEKIEQDMYEIMAIPESLMGKSKERTGFVIKNLL